MCFYKIFMRLLMLFCFVSVQSAHAVSMDITSPTGPIVDISAAQPTIAGQITDIGGGLDLMIVLDNSGSLISHYDDDIGKQHPGTDPEGKRFIGINQLLDSLASYQSMPIRVGLVFFSGDFYNYATATVAVALQPIETAYGEILDFIADADDEGDKYWPYGGTPIGSGIKAATDVFGSNCEESYSCAILLFTDGAETLNTNPSASAKEAFEKGINIYVITLVTKTDEHLGQANEIATQGGTKEALSVNNTESLVAAFQDPRLIDIQAVSVTNLTTNTAFPATGNLYNFSATPELAIGSNDIQFEVTLQDGTTTTIPYSLQRGTNPQLLQYTLEILTGGRVSLDQQAISLDLAGDTYSGLLSTQTANLSPFSGEAQLVSAGDLNDDSLDDIFIRYPDGTQQTLFYFGPEPYPYRAVLRHHLQTARNAVAVSISDDNKLYYTLDQPLDMALAAVETNGIAADGQIRWEDNVGDLNGDGLADKRITYPNGHRQVLYNLTVPLPDLTDEASQTAPPAATDISTILATYDFLYQGTNPLQTGVADGALDEARATVLRGMVTSRGGQALPRVTVGIAERSEFGTTQTLTDGSFSLLVNGGEPLTIRYSRPGYLSAQRTVDTTAQSVMWVPEVALVAAAPPQRVVLPGVDDSPEVVTGASVTSSVELNPELNRPPRQPVLVIPDGTQATVTAEDGTQQSAASLDLSITEYTVDDNDLAAMPTPLPENTGYTYAINIRAEQGEDVRLSRAIPLYVDNFLDFPVGSTVPLGRLEEDGAWTAAADGRVIRVLGTDNGVQLDVDGSGQPASAQSLADLNISAAELAEIGSRYQAGDSLWRVRIDRAGAYDINWPLKDPDNPDDVEQAVSKGETLEANDLLNLCRIPGNSVVEVETQTLDEILPVTGTPFTLHYRSNRAPGDESAYTLDVPLQDSTVAPPKRIVLEIHLAGRKITKVFADDPQYNPAGALDTPSYRFVWDSNDEFGRQLYGGQNVHIRLGYVYDGEYQVPQAVAESFGLPGTALGLGIPARQEVTGWHEYTVKLGGWTPESAGLGGLTLDIHHTYDPNTQRLYRGDGRLRRVLHVDQTDAGYLIAAADGGLIYTFNATGRHLRTTDSLDGQTLYAFGYNSDGYLATISDRHGDITTIERDTNNQPLGILAPDGQYSVISVRNDDLFAALTNPQNETYAFAYNAQSLLARFTNPRDYTTEYDYEDGLLTGVTNALGHGYTLQRSTAGNSHSITMTTTEGFVNRFGVSGLNSDVLSQNSEAADGTVTDFRRETLADEREQFTTTYSDGTQLTVVTGPDPRFGMQAPVVQSSLLETPAGLRLESVADRQVALAQADDPLSLQTLTETVTVNGRPTQSVYDRTNRSLTATSAAGRQSTTFFDIQGRVAEVQTPGLLPVRYRYDSRGRVEQTTVGTDDEARTTTYTYNADGYVKTITDVLDRSVELQYDLSGRVTQQTLPGGRTVQYRYDANGNLREITPPGRTAHTFDYDEIDRQTVYLPPTTEGMEEPRTRYEYDADNRLQLMTRPDGRQVRYVYDDTEDDGTPRSGRLRAIEELSAEDERLKRTTYSYDAHGKLSGLSAPDQGSLVYAYDGPLPRSEAWGNGPVTGSVSFSYDNDLRVAAMQVNGAYTVDYGYDADGLLIRAGFITLHRHPQNGLLSSTRLDGLRTDREYNGFGELKTVSAAYYDTQLYRAAYQHDKLGRITRKTEIVNGVTTVYDYGYDPAGRLETVTVNGVAAETYRYDANGNRTSVVYADRSIDTIVTDAQDRLRQYGDTTYEYTANGELARKTAPDGSVTEYGYDIYGNLHTVTLPGQTIEYLIDARNRRIGKRVDGELVQSRLYQDSLNPAAELDAYGNVATRFVYASKSNVPDYLIRGTKIYRIISDHLGSVRLVVDLADGRIVQQMDYDAFGRVLADSNPGFQPFGFAGGLYDPDTGLVRFGARDYDAEIGRWLSKDPIGFDGGDTNFYGYVLGDPINFIDPNGEYWWFTATAGAVIGGVAGGVSAWMSGGSVSDIVRGAGRGAIVGGVTGLTLGVGGSALAGLAGGGIAGGVISGATAGAVGELAGQGFDISMGSRCSLDWGSIGIAGGLGGLFGGAFLRPYTTSQQTVTSWASQGITPDLNPGRWVMTGGPSVGNYARTVGPALSRYPYSNNISATVSGGSLSTPPGMTGNAAALLGQRIIH